MKKIPFSKIYKHGKAFLVKHSADILTAFTAAGVVLTGIETHKATKKAEEYLRINGYDQANPETKKVLKWESRKNYILPAVIGASTIGAAIGANYINHTQIAGLAAACTVAETALSEHRDKIEELMGANALQKIDDEINLDHAANILDNDEPVLDTGKGNVMCCEGYLTGRKFMASPDWVRKCVNEFNERVNYDTYCAYSEFLELLWRDHLASTPIPRSSDAIGYNIHQNGLLRVEITSDIDPKTGLPYLIFCPSNPPIANFMEIL